MISFSSVAQSQEENKRNAKKLTFSNRGNFLLSPGDDNEASKVRVFFTIKIYLHDGDDDAKCGALNAFCECQQHQHVYVSFVVADDVAGGDGHGYPSLFDDENSHQREYYVAESSYVAPSGHGDLDGAHFATPSN